jgi:hypothetical protein
MRFNVQFPGKHVMADVTEDSVLTFFPELKPHGLKLFNNFTLTSIIFIRHNGETITVTRRDDK